MKTAFLLLETIGYFLSFYLPNKKAKPPLKGAPAFYVKTFCISPAFPQDGLCSVLNFLKKVV